MGLFPFSPDGQLQCFFWVVSHSFVPFAFLPNEQMTGDASPLPNLLTFFQIASSFDLMERRGEKKEKKMFQWLCLTDKINCTYKIQITLFNLKMIGPGPSPKASSVGWCMASVYSSSANQALQSAFQASGAELGGNDVLGVMQPEDV